MIERTSKKKMGFTCWKLFTIDYFRCYQVSLFANKYELTC